MTQVEIENLKQKRFMHSHFVDSLISGNYEVPTGRVRDIVNNHHFGFANPLIPLSLEEEKILRRFAIRSLSSYFHDDDFKDLCGPLFFDGETIYVRKVRKVYEEDRPDLARPLSTDDRLRMFFDPSWHQLRIRTTNCTSSAGRYGNRKLVGEFDEYFGSEEEFKRLLSEIRQKSGAQKLRILDVGCGVGRALEAMKKIDPDLETHGLTFEQEPGMYEADRFHYLLAERMPSDFLNSFHWIKSQIAFRYFVFPHLALCNVILALALGGLAHIGYAFDRIPEDDFIRDYFKKLVPGTTDSFEAMRVLTQKLIARLDQLTVGGLIHCQMAERLRRGGCGGRIVIEKIREISTSDLWPI